MSSTQPVQSDLSIAVDVLKGLEMAGRAPVKATKEPDEVICLRAPHVINVYFILVWISSTF